RGGDRGARRGRDRLRTGARGRRAPGTGRSAPGAGRSGRTRVNSTRTDGNLGTDGQETLRKTWHAWCSSPHMGEQSSIRRCAPRPRAIAAGLRAAAPGQEEKPLMEINVVGRHMDVPDRFRRHLTEKLDKVTQFAPAALRVDVEVSQEKNPRQAELSDRVELTVHENGAVIRSEARADDLYGALDIA